MGILEDAAEWLESQRIKDLSVPVEYRTRSGEVYTVNATLGKTLFRAKNEYGTTIRIETRDFLISAEELPDTPERGDAVIYNGRLYEVLAPNGEPHWRWSGTRQILRRIHTKEIGNG